MKRLLHLNLSLLLLLGGSCLLAQSDFTVLWDSVYAGNSHETLHDLILLRDGRLAAAGEIQLHDSSRNGLFLLIEPTTGKITRRTFGGSGDQSFNGLAEADDGTFYLVGYAKTESLGKQGWMVRLDETGAPFKDEKGKPVERLYGKTGDDWFEKIAWMPNGSGIIAGFSNQISEGYLWMLTVDNNECQVKSNVGSGFVGDLVAMQKDNQGRLWLCGNPRKATRKDDAWLLQLDENVLLQPPGELPAGYSKTKEEVLSMHITFDDEIILAGTTKQTADGETDAWVATYDHALQDIVPRFFESEGSETVRSICKSFSGTRWMVQRTGRGDAFLMSWVNDVLEENKLLFDREDDFQASFLLMTYLPDTYILAGKAKDRDRKGRKGIRLLCFQQIEKFTLKADSKREDDLASAEDLDKALSKGEPTGAKSPGLSLIDFKFDDANKDGFLSPGELAAMDFNVKNNSAIAVTEGKIRVEKETVVGGLIVKPEMQYFHYLGPGASRNFDLSLEGEADLQAGTSKFHVIIESKGSPPLRVTFDVESIRAPKAVGGKKASLVFSQPRLAGAERKVPAMENLQEIRLTVATNRPLRKEDVKIFNNGTPQEEKKAETQLKDLGFQQSNYQYEVISTVSLTDSLNEVYVLVDGQCSDTIIFERYSNRPDLHILAIGPLYQDLKYNAKDARDFAYSFAGQAGKGFFDQVFVDSLWTSARTTKAGIEWAFEKMMRRATGSGQGIANGIKPNDYLFVFYSGHGIKKNGKFYLQPFDYDAEQEMGAEFLVDYQELMDRFLDKIECKKVLFIDACHSGASGAKSGGADMSMATALQEANSTVEGLMSFTSCSANELSWEHKDWENGAFTKALLEALRGDGFQLTAAQGEQFIPVRANQLSEFLKKRVKELVETKNLAQTPDLDLNGMKDITIFSIPKK